MRFEYAGPDANIGGIIYDRDTTPPKVVCRDPGKSYQSILLSSADLFAFMPTIGLSGVSFGPNCFISFDALLGERGPIVRAQFEQWAKGAAAARQAACGLPLSPEQSDRVIRDVRAALAAHDADRAAAPVRVGTAIEFSGSGTGENRASTEVQIAVYDSVPISRGSPEAIAEERAELIYRQENPRAEATVSGSTDREAIIRASVALLAMLEPGDPFFADAIVPLARKLKTELDRIEAYRGSAAI